MLQNRSNLLSIVQKKEKKKQVKECSGLKDAHKLTLCQKYSYVNEKNRFFWKVLRF